MNPTKSNPCDRRVRSLLAAIAMAALLVSSASAQRSGNSGTTQAGGRGQGQGSGAQAGGTGLTPEQAFRGGVQRGGAVGESSAGPVGASATSTAGASAGGLGGRAGGGLGGGFGGGGLGAAFGNMFNNNAGRSTSSTPPLRTRLRSAVAVPAGLAPSPLMRQYTAESRLHSVLPVQPRNDFYYEGVPFMPANPYAGVNVQINDRTAVLQGTVANESDRRMSELLMRLEPGVSSVQNRINLAQ